ncbi:MAG: hypothetical protein AAGM67_21230, partial [Bacteroidota bacterium]
LGLTVAFSLPKKQGDGICDCTPLTAQEAVDQADLIFKGTCTRVTTNWIAGGMKYSFSIEESWKRRSDVHMIVNSGWESDCGFEFEEGQTYLVFANKKFSLQTTRCSGTSLYREDLEAFSLLQDIAPAEIAPSPMVGMMIWTIAILGGFSILFVAFVVLRNRGKQQ